jgi:hypothetical protein
MIRAITIALTLLFAGSLCAQGIYGRKKPEIFPTDGKMRRGGFYFAPGLTYALPRGKDHEEQYFNTPDSAYTALFDPKGKIGLYLEAGWFLSTRDPIILDYWDFGLAYKQLKGTEAFTSTYMRSDTTSFFAGEGAFNDQHLTAHVNANKLIQTRDYQFVQLSLGANLDWRFGTNRSYTADSHGAQPLGLSAGIHRTGACKSGLWFQAHAAAHGHSRHRNAGLQHRPGRWRQLRQAAMVQQHLPPVDPQRTLPLPALPERLRLRAGEEQRL